MLAEAISGSETAFVERMNATAKRLGMTRTHFVNTNGLPETDLVSTARDLGKLASAVITEYPQYSSYWSMPAMRIGKRRLGSHNALLKTFPGADGLKTGFTCDSGYNVIASATRDGRRLLAVVLGETSGNERAIRSASLLEYGFQNYGWKQLFNTTSLDTLPVDPSAKGISSVRDAVAAWGCNPGRHKGKAMAHKRGKAKTSAAKGKAAKDGGAASAVQPALKAASSGGATRQPPKSVQAASP
jgi:D-alanyl-D-alanine carboxypeptidase